MTDILAALSAAFPPEAISWRVGATTGDKSRGLALAYIDARDVQDRLNQVCGINWQVRNPWSAGNKLACEIGIKIDGEWIWRGDGAGDSDVEAEKGAFSDAFKRAAVRWGVGRYLYSLESPWVALTKQGNSNVIAESEYAKLRALLTRNGAPPQSTPAPADPKADEYRVVSQQLRGEIDGALDTVAIRGILEGPAFADLEKYSKKAADFLRDRAEKRAGVIAQAPRKAA